MRDDDPPRSGDAGHPASGDEVPGDERPASPARVGLGTQRSPDEPAWTRLLAPLRSEGAAFHALLAAAAVCGVFAAVVLIVRALG